MLNYEQFKENLDKILAVNYLKPTLEDGFIAIPFGCLGPLFPTNFVDFEHQISAKICNGYIAVLINDLAFQLNVSTDKIKELFE